MKKIYALFMSCLLLFLLNQAMKVIDIEQPEILRNYLNDLLAMPITLTLCLLLTRTLHKNSSIRLSLFSALSVAGLYSFYFEYFLPMNSARYTADVVDVCLYFAGAVIFYLIQPSQNRMLKSKRIK